MLGGKALLLLGPTCLHARMHARAQGVRVAPGASALQSLGITSERVLRAWAGLGLRKLKVGLVHASLGVYGI